MEDSSTTGEKVPEEVQSGPVPTPGLQKLRGEFTNALETQQKDVSQSVAWKLADEEMDRRTGLLVKAYKDHKALSGEIRKLESKPDVRTFTADGKVASEGFTKETTDKIKTAKDKLLKLEKAMEAAIGQADYSKLS